MVDGIGTHGTGVGSLFVDYRGHRIHLTPNKSTLQLLNVICPMAWLYRRMEDETAQTTSMVDSHWLWMCLTAKTNTLLYLP